MASGRTAAKPLMRAGRMIVVLSEFRIEMLRMKEDLLRILLSEL